MIALLAVALLNDGWYIFSGSEQPFKSEHASIQMVREHVHMDLRLHTVDVRVEFVFKNHGEATTVQMGFPEEGGSNMKDGIEAFKSTVDGEPVFVRRVVLRETEDDFEAVWVKRVRFEKGQTRTIVNTYSQALSGNTHGSLSATYIFSTGKTWFGSIEEIRLTYAFDPKDGNSDPFPSRWVGGDDAHNEHLQPTVIGKHERKLIWRDVEPDFRFHLDLVRGFWKVEVNGLLIPSNVLSSAQPGDGRDVLVGRHDVDRVFGEPVRSGTESWSGGTRVRWQERGVRFVGDDAMLIDGKTVTLRRPIKERPVFPGNEDGPRAEFVYLRDVVEALGGTYRYDPALDKVFIRVPVPK